MADRVGQQLGNYRLVSLLGQGGFAKVYLGEHVFLKTKAAIKVLHTQLATSFRFGGSSSPRFSIPLSWISMVVRAGKSMSMGSCITVISITFCLLLTH